MIMGSKGNGINENTQNMLDVVHTFLKPSLEFNGDDEDADRAKLGQVFQSIAQLRYEATSGSDLAQIQLAALERTLYPARYGISFADLKQFVEQRNIPPSVKRACGFINLATSLLAISESGVEEWHDLKPLRFKLNEEKREVNPSLYEAAKQRVGKRTTLQSLTMKLYLQEAENEGKRISERTIMRDLEAYERWIVNAPSNWADVARIIVWHLMRDTRRHFKRAGVTKKVRKLS